MDIGKQPSFAMIGNTWLDGLSGEVFDSEWRKCSAIEKCSVTVLDKYIREHYLGKRPAIVMLALKMTVRKEPVGMVLYAMPPREADTRYGGKTWELARSTCWTKFRATPRHG